MALVLISVAIVFGAPEVWRFTPDSGVYVGSAVSLVEDGRYWFNGHPNLLYYPGTSALLTIPITLFGMSFHAMHILFALLAVATLWLARAYFSTQRYGWVGLLLPLFLGANQLFQLHSQLVLSDLPFLNLVLLALLLWRKFETTGNQRWFFACAAVVALAPMFRFQGLFLIGAFGLALLTYIYRNRQAGWASGIKYLAIAGLVLLPFLLWTLRNYQLHTADTYNMANKAFFGLSGLRISGPGFGRVDWIDADWKYPVYQLMYLFGGLGNTFLGKLGDHIGLELVTAGVLGLIVTGGWSWLKRAGTFEAAFVLTAAAMIIYQKIGSKSLYHVVRYWIPLLPFFIVIAGLGIRQVGELLSITGYRRMALAGAGTLALILLFAGGIGWADRLSSANNEKIAGNFDTSMTVAEYVRNQVPTERAILATDWGVAPLLTGRRTYQYQRSSCDKPTLELILDKDPAYLVILPKFRRYKMALDMAEHYLQVFREVFATGNRDKGPFGAVYAIEKEQIPSLIADLRCPWEK